MIASTYYLIENSGVFVGTGFTPDGTLPANAIACPADVAKSWESYVPDGKGGYITAPTAQLLAQAQSAQISALAQAYKSAIVQPVSYTSKGGVTKTYQADPGSLSNLQNSILGFQSAGATPSGFYWVSADNTQVPFAYADMQGLAAALLAQGWAAFQHLQNLKADVMAATSVSAVQAIVW